MTQAFLCLTIRFLDPEPTFHGRGEGGDPEWPPSPLRVFQALVAAAAARWRGSNFIDHSTPALKWLAATAPVIVTPEIPSQRTPYRMYVPHNAGDLMTAAWDRGDTNASMAKHRIEKDVWATRLVNDSQELKKIQYLYEIPDNNAEFARTAKIISEAASSITHLGWGIDMVTANASIIDSDTASNLIGERWHPTVGGSSRLRIPRDGTLNGLIQRHEAFLNRIGADGFNPVPPLSEFNVATYQSSSESIARPFVVFELLNDDDSKFGYPQDKLIHIAGMVRHLAIESMKKSPPLGVPDDWTETCVAGHAKPGTSDHRQFSYLPLPSIGHVHTNPAVRRVMIAAPVGDARLLNHLARYLTGQRLKPTDKTKMPHPPTLVKIDGDGVIACYTRPANSWATVTPVILPGHDDHKPEKTRRLILKALQQSGIDQSCTFTWSALPNFRQCLTAHKYDRKKNRIGYIRPDHLLNLTAVHLRLTFDHPVAGPLAIGAGRHCGLGICATT